MIQMHSCTVFQRVVTIILFELCQLVRSFTIITALFAVFQPQKIQGNAALLHFTCHILIVGHFVLWLCCTCRIQYFCKLLVGHAFRKWVAESIFLSKADCMCNSVSGVTACCCNLAFVEPETVLSQYFTVIGHLYDLLFCIHAFACNTILP